MEKLRKAFGACLVPLLSILLAFLVGGIIMAALGADPRRCSVPLTAG